MGFDPGGGLPAGPIDGDSAIDSEGEKTELKRSVVKEAEAEAVRCLAA
jgi:hypothetical protein